MKLREGVYDIITRVNEFDDNSDFSEKYIEELINQSRAKFIERDYMRKRLIQLDTRQSITVPLETVNSSNDTNLLESNRFIVRTSLKLPKILTLNKLPGIYGITSIDRNIGEFDLMDKERARYATDAPFCPTAVYLDTDDRAYFISSHSYIRNIRYVTFDFVLEDPREVIGYSYGDARDTEITELEDYPVSKKIWGYIKDDVVAKLLGNKFTPADIAQPTAEMRGNPMPSNSNSEYNVSVRNGM